MRSTVLAIALALLALLVAIAPGSRAQAAAGRDAAATENELATRDALAQMKAGGNAVDAAVCAALIGGVASPSSSGLGGGGFALVWMASDAKARVVDFRETAAQGLDAPAFEVRPLAQEQRGKLVGVPGEVAGLFEIHRRFGKRPWADVVAPAARWAKHGFPVSRHLANALADSGKLLTLDAGIASIFYRGNKPAALGHLVTNAKLAATLERVAAEGPKAFYEGPIAEDLVEAARSAGGALTLSELKAYRPVERQPIKVRWEGHEVFTMPPPSAGGLMLAQTLGMFSRAELEPLGRESGAYHHLVAEALRGAVADRMRYLGDPDHTPVDLAKLLAPKRLAARKQTIALDRTHAIPRFGLEEHGTHHLVTADAAGNVVSLTTTVNRVFGAKLSGAKSGVVLNDQLDDFTTKHDVKPFGMNESPNRARAGARPVSSMTPTIVLRDGRPVLALGGSGGSAIASNVTQLVLSRLVFGMKPAEAVKAPRFYIPSSGAYILLEKGASPKLVQDLEQRGEIVGTMQFTSSAIQMIAIENGRKLPASDPRKYGSAAVR